MGTRRALTAATMTALLLTAGCTGQTAIPAGIPMQPTPTAASPTQVSVEPIPEPDDTVATTPIEAECVDTDHLAFGFSVVDAALGRRYFTVTVANCTQRDVALPSTVPLSAVDSDGQPVDLTWEQRARVGGDVIASGETRYLNLKWLSSGRCERGSHTVLVEMDGSRAERADCFQLGGLDDLGAGVAQWSTDPWNPL